MAYDSIIEQYRELSDSLTYIERTTQDAASKALRDKGVYNVSVVTQVMSEEQLTDKLERLGNLVSPDVFNDLVTLRIICDYMSDLDTAAQVVDDLFAIDSATVSETSKNAGGATSSQRKGRTKTYLDWKQEIIGYAFAKYVCFLDGDLVSKDDIYTSWMPFTVVVTTRLHDTWESLVEGLGYANDIDCPSRLRHDLIGTSYQVQMADRALSRIHDNAVTYRAEIAQQASRDEVDLLEVNADTFEYWLDTRPFDRLNERIASSVQATVSEDSLDLYLPILDYLGIHTYRQANAVVRQYEDDAYNIASHQLAGVELPTISSTVGIQYIAIAYICGMGGGIKDIANLMEVLGLEREEAIKRAMRLIDIVGKASEPEEEPEKEPAVYESPEEPSAPEDDAEDKESEADEAEEQHKPAKIPEDETVTEPEPEPEDATVTEPEPEPEDETVTEPEPGPEEEPAVDETPKESQPTVEDTDASEDIQEVARDKAAEKEPDQPVAEAKAESQPTGDQDRNTAANETQALLEALGLSQKEDILHLVGTMLQANRSSELAASIAQVGELTLVLKEAVQAMTLASTRVPVPVAALTAPLEETPAAGDAHDSRQENAREVEPIQVTATVTADETAPQEVAPSSESMQEAERAGSETSVQAAQDAYGTDAPLPNASTEGPAAEAPHEEPEPTPAPTPEAAPEPEPTPAPKPEAAPEPEPPAADFVQEEKAAEDPSSRQEAPVAEAEDEADAKIEVGLVADASRRNPRTEPAEVAPADQVTEDEAQSGQGQIQEPAAPSRVETADVEEERAAEEVADAPALIDEPAIPATTVSAEVEVVPSYREERASEPASPLPDNGFDFGTDEDEPAYTGIEITFASDNVDAGFASLDSFVDTQRAADLTPRPSSADLTPIDTRETEDVFDFGTDEDEPAYTGVSISFANENVARTTPANTVFANTPQGGTVRPQAGGRMLSERDIPQVPAYAADDRSRLDLEGNNPSGDSFTFIPGMNVDDGYDDDEFHFVVDDEDEFAYRGIPIAFTNVGDVQLTARRPDTTAQLPRSATPAPRNNMGAQRATPPNPPSNQRNRFPTNRNRPPQRGGRHFK